MTENSIWKKAQTVELQVSENIMAEFSIGFDKRIPIEVEQELRSFVTWVENNYRIPITLWVDFEYNHYLISRSGKRVGYLFYWADFSLIQYLVMKKIFHRYAFLCEQNIALLRRFLLLLLKHLLFTMPGFAMRYLKDIHLMRMM